MLTLQLPPKPELSSPLSLTSCSAATGAARTTGGICNYPSFQCHSDHCKNLLSATYTTFYSSVLFSSIVSMTTPAHWLKTWVPGFFSIPNPGGGWLGIYVHNIMTTALASESLTDFMPGDLYLPLYFHCHHQDSVTNWTPTPFISQIHSPHTNSNHTSFQLFSFQIISKCALWLQRNSLSSFNSFSLSP